MIGTAFIAVANFVGQLMDVQTKRIVMILPCQSYSRADYVSKNVCPTHTHTHISFCSADTHFSHLE